MKFGYIPHGRKDFWEANGWGNHIYSYQASVYYLMEIDEWGRRFFHRGGLKTGSLAKENTTSYDKRENRHMRKHFGQMPEDGKMWVKESIEQDSNLVLEDKWKAIEFEMTYDVDQDPEGPPKETLDTSKKKGPDGIVFSVVDAPAPTTWHLRLEKDANQHAYQIVGSWMHFRAPQEMTPAPDGSWTFEVTLGLEGFEQFFFIEDGDFNRKIYPAVERSYKDMPAIGPHTGPKTPQFWQITGSPGDDMPQDDAGEPGDKYLVTFKWDNVKRVFWEKIGTGDGAPTDDGVYFVMGSWNCFDPKPMENKDGVYTMEAQLTRLGLEFQIKRGHDWSGPDDFQTIYPDVEEGFGNAFSAVGPLGVQASKFWNIEGSEGDVFNITLTRDLVDPSEITVTWSKVRNQAVGEVYDRFFMSGIFNGNTAEGYELTYDLSIKAFKVEVPIYVIPTAFNIVANKRLNLRIHPDKKDCSQIQQHEVKGPDTEWDGFNWLIGKSSADKARQGDTFVVKMELEGKRAITWKKKD
jgi:hypothetical protein